MTKGEKTANTIRLSGTPFRGAGRVLGGGGEVMISVRQGTEIHSGLGIRGSDDGLVGRLGLAYDLLLQLVGETGVLALVLFRLLFGMLGVIDVAAASTLSTTSDVRGYASCGMLLLDGEDRSWATYPGVVVSVLRARAHRRFRDDLLAVGASGALQMRRADVALATSLSARSAGTIVAKKNSARDGCYHLHSRR